MTRSSLLGSWIDVAAATAAAETLCQPPVPTDDPRPPTVALKADPEINRPAERAEGPPPETPAGPPPPQLHGRLRALRERAERNGLVSSPPTDGLPPRPFAVPLGSLPVRVRALADWMNECFEPQALFVADDLGQPLVEFRGGVDLLAAASVLADAAAKARRHLPGNESVSVVHLTLGPGQVLSLVSVTTVVGRWHAGMTTAMALEESAVMDLARSLQEAAAGA
ncbi:MAG: hypothetical protein ACKV19_08295 [Verrucomicrobiales bacterium]